MKTLKILSLLLFLFIAVDGFSQDNVTGVYFTPARDGKISIYKKGNTYSGKIIWSVQNMTDTKNPNPALRTRKMVGADVMSGFKYDDGEYVDGKIYDPTSGKTYDCKMWLEGNKLKVRGYIGVSLLGRTETFTRVS